MIEDDLDIKDIDSDLIRKVKYIPNRLFVTFSNGLEVTIYDIKAADWITYTMMPEKYLTEEFIINLIFSNKIRLS